ncbi:hypothetical protein [Streptomyces sp. ODS28]|uniref:COG1470 family protein n=1 Tax=Streptomyces sp. ODS28 TaxID=3136688 RepID=UPI0031EFBD3F
MRTRGAAAALLCALLCGAWLPQEAAAASPDGARGGWSAAPVTSDGALKQEGGARTGFYLAGEPGTVLKDAVAVVNKSAQARTYRVRGTGKWFAFAKKQVRVPARTRAEIPFTVTLPGGAVPGDHPSAVVVGDGQREQRVGVRLRVLGPALSALSVEDVRVRDTGKGPAEIAYVLVNRGNTTLSPRLSVRADGVFGELLRRPERALDVELPPGARKRMREPWSSPPALDSAKVSLRVAAQAGAKGEGSAGYTAVPWGVFGGLGAVAAAGAAVAWRLRRRPRREGEQG